MKCLVLSWLFFTACSRIFPYVCSAFTRKKLTERIKHQKVPYLLQLRFGAKEIVVSVHVLGLQVLDSPKKGSIVLREVKFPHLGGSGMLVITANYKKNKIRYCQREYTTDFYPDCGPRFQGLGAMGQLKKKKKPVFWKVPGSKRHPETKASAEALLNCFTCVQFSNLSWVSFVTLTISA